MFNFIVRYLGFLKFVPGLSHLFDVWLKVYTFAARPALLDWMDDITYELAQWDGVTVSMHKYGGTQFDYREKEIGHIHGNGLLDMLLSRKIKQQLMQDGRIQDHHRFKDTGWVSFYIYTIDDKEYAVQLLKLGYERLNQRYSVSI